MYQIFVLEDDQEIARNLTRLLRSDGYSVTCRPTAEEALLMLYERRFDLALLDISLLDGNGFSVCTEIKSKYGIHT